MSNAHDAVARGLILFPPAGQTFPGRHGGTKDYVINTRGAGAILELRALIVEQLSRCAESGPEFDVVGGLAKAGTSWGAWLAWVLNKPFANVLLDGARASGLQREVEGDVASLRVLIVDNWTRSGRSLAQGATVVERAGGRCVGGLTVVRHGRAECGLPLQAAWSIGELLSAAQELGLWAPQPTHPDLQT